MGFTIPIRHVCAQLDNILDMTVAMRDCDKDVETASWFKGGAGWGRGLR